MQDADGELLLALGRLGGDARSDFVRSSGAALASDRDTGGGARRPAS
jgi:hypothetical protein